MSFIEYFESPIGRLEITATDTHIQSVLFVEEATKAVKNNQLTQLCSEQLQAYFAGTSKAFDLPIAQAGTTFQLQVWQALLTIPYGHLASYRDIAQKIENPKAVRAVGAANGKNPLTLIVPCHRVIGSNGTLTGYAGGVERKQWLLQHEAKQLFS